MSKSFHGTPSWYELATGKGQLKAAGDFYAQLFGWTVADSGMPAFAYHLAKADGDMVAGLMEMPDDVGSLPPFWMIYFAVDDTDKFVIDARAAGAVVHRGPTDIPQTGRFALLADPQGAGFGILQPDMSTMSPADIAKAEAGEGAFNPKKPGHAQWHELMTTDPDAGFDFYASMFGWTKSQAMNMGAMGTYQLFSHDGTDIGGMMGLGNAPVPNWLPYFGVADGVSATIEAVKAAGGQVHHGPQEVPGGSYIAICQDPQGAWFAVVGSKK